VFRARERGFKQFKCPVRNVLISCDLETSLLRSGDCLSSIIRGLQDKQRDHMLHLYLKSMLMEGCGQFMEPLVMMTDVFETVDTNSVSTSLIA
jgi:hypothetical protein